MANTVDVFQDGVWKVAPIVAELEVTVNDKNDIQISYVEPVSNRIVTCLKSSLPYKDEAEAQAVRKTLSENNN